MLYTPCDIALATLSPGSCLLLFCLIIIVFLGYGQGNSNRLRALSKNPSLEAEQHFLTCSIRSGGSLDLDRIVPEVLMSFHLLLVPESRAGVQTSLSLPLGFERHRLTVGLLLT